jgi:hypothetical protein
MGEVKCVQNFDLEFNTRVSSNTTSNMGEMKCIYINIYINVYIYIYIY